MQIALNFSSIFNKSEAIRPLIEFFQLFIKHIIGYFACFFKHFPSLVRRVFFHIIPPYHRYRDIIMYTNSKKNRKLKKRYVIINKNLRRNTRIL